MGVVISFLLWCGASWFLLKQLDTFTPETRRAVGLMVVWTLALVMWVGSAIESKIK